MNTTDLLIIATAAGPIVATLVAPGFTSAVLALARARAGRVECQALARGQLVGELVGVSGHNRVTHLDRPAVYVVGGPD
jgi:hypothetical protein